MRERGGSHWLGVLLISGLLAGLAWGETLEMVTYYPAPSAGGGDFDRLHANRATIGEEYNRTNVPDEDVPDGHLFVFDRLGIGTTEPVGPLHVVGADDTTGSIVFLPGADTGAAGTPKIQVGIGTAAPTRAVDVRGHLVLNTDPDSPENGGELVLANVDPLTTATWHMDNFGPQDRLRIFHQPGINIAGQEFFTVTNNGNVGIGTGNPSAQLNVHSATTQATLLLSGLSDGGQTYGGLYFSDQTQSVPANAWAVVFKNKAGQPDQRSLQFVRFPEGVRMQINPNGNVGIGTEDPGATLHVNGGVDVPMAVFTGRRLRGAGMPPPPDPSSYVLLRDLDSAQSWGLRVGDAGDFGIHQVSAADRVTIRSNGNVGIGTRTPAYKLDVAGQAHATGFPTSSDARLKTHVTPLTGVLRRLEGIRPILFDWNKRYEAMGRASGHREIGLIAQELEKAFPELVTQWGEEDYRAVDYGRFTAVLLAAVKELEAENRQLEERVKALERERDEILKR